jgi:hypothetical protein
MELSQQQFDRIADCLPRQRGNVIPTLQDNPTAKFSQ